MVRGGATHHVLSVTHRPGSFSDWNVVYAVSHLELETVKLGLLE